MAVVKNAGIGRFESAGPIQIQLPTEERAAPAVGNHRRQGIAGDCIHGDHPHCNTSHRHNEELQYLGEYHTEHSTLDYIDGGDGGDDQTVKNVVPVRIGVQLPRQKYRGEFANANEAVGEKADHTDQGKNHHDQVRQACPQTFAKTERDPLSSGHHSRATQPDGQEYHQKNLVEYRPQPGNVNTGQPVDKQQIHQPHSAADIEHARGIRDSQVVPGQFVAPKKVTLNIFGSSPGNPETDQEGRGKVRQDDKNIDKCELQRHEWESIGLLFELA